MTRWQLVGGHALVAVSCLLAGCGSETPVADPGPVFALDRDLAATIEEVDADRTDVLAAGDLTLTLQELLTEHVVITAEVMRAAADDAPHLDAARAAMTANTDDLTRTMGVAYGPAGAHAFDQLWTQHIEFFTRYAHARGDGDDAAAETALDQLGDYTLDFSSFCDLATGGGAPADAVEDLLHAHVDQLIGQLDAWVEGDHAGARAIVTEAASHTDTIASALAAAISAQQPLAFPGDPAAGDAASIQLALTLLVDQALLVGDPSDAAAVVAAVRDATGADEGPLAEWADALAGWRAGEDDGATTLRRAAARVDAARPSGDGSPLVELTDALVEALGSDDLADLVTALPELHDAAVAAGRELRRVSA